MPIKVITYFESFIKHISLTDGQTADALTKAASVNSCLGKAYYGDDYDQMPIVIGSYSKGTSVRPPRDIDTIFEMPVDATHRFNAREGNKQSQLLQEVRATLLATFPNTEIKADGPAIKVSFSTFAVEVVPAIKISNSRDYLICITRDGGRWQRAEPHFERELVERVNSNSSGSLVALIKMLKIWQQVNTVPLKSYHLEILATDFMRQYKYRSSAVYYDWMLRDFFRFLTGLGRKAIGSPGGLERFELGNDWKTKAGAASQAIDLALDLWHSGYPYTAQDEWEKVFGDYVRGAEISMTEGS